MCRPGGESDYGSNRSHYNGVAVRKDPSEPHRWTQAYIDWTLDQARKGTNYPDPEEKFRLAYQQAQMRSNERVENNKKTDDGVLQTKFDQSVAEQVVARVHNAERVQQEQQRQEKENQEIKQCEELVSETIRLLGLVLDHIADRNYEGFETYDSTKWCLLVSESGNRPFWRITQHNDPPPHFAVDGILGIAEITEEHPCTPVDLHNPYPTASGPSYFVIRSLFDYPFDDIFISRNRDDVSSPHRKFVLANQAMRKFLEGK